MSYMDLCLISRIYAKFFLLVISAIRSTIKSLVPSKGMFPTYDLILHNFASWNGEMDNNIIVSDSLSQIKDQEQHVPGGCVQCGSYLSTSHQRRKSSWLQGKKSSIQYYEKR